jgi:hypothetical protein
VGWFDIHPEDDKAVSRRTDVYLLGCVTDNLPPRPVEAESNSSAPGATTLSPAATFS